MNIGRVLFLTAFASFCSGTTALAAEECHLKPRALIAAGIDASGRVTVPMSFNGHDLTMLVDTGGYFTALSAESVQSLGLHTQQVRGVTMFNGDLITRAATADQVVLGQLKAAHWDFLVVPANHLGTTEDGILGPDVLKKFDAEFDFAKAKLNLFSQDHCPGKVSTGRLTTTQAFRSR